MVLFYQRSKRDIWYKQEHDLDAISCKIDLETFKEFKLQIARLNQQNDPDETVLTPIVFANFSQSKHKFMSNPLDLVGKLTHDDLSRKTVSALEEFKTDLEKEYIDDYKNPLTDTIKEIYDQHFIVNYAQIQANETYGGKWMKLLVDKLPYPQST